MFGKEKKVVLGFRKTVEIFLNSTALAIFHFYGDLIPLESFSVMIGILLAIWSILNFVTLYGFLTQVSDKKQNERNVITFITFVSALFFFYKALENWNNPQDGLWWISFSSIALYKLYHGKKRNKKQA